MLEEREVIDPVQRRWEACWCHQVAREENRRHYHRDDALLRLLKRPILTRSNSDPLRETASVFHNFPSAFLSRACLGK
jgi:hypothetical protein